jgi:predicted dehydrogenase
MSNSLDRRHFLQHAAAVAGAWTVGHSLQADSAEQAVKPAAQAAANSADGTIPAPAATAPATGVDQLQPVRVGIMGLSRGMALAELFAAVPGVQVVYLCDVDQQRLGHAAQRLVERHPQVPRPQTVADFRTILDDPQIDALVCAAPNHWHGPATLFATMAGKHTYVEKPCCHTPQEGEWMVSAAARAKRLVQMGTQRRSSPGTIEAIAQLQRGTIGRVYLARSWYSNRRPSIGRGHAIPVPTHLDYELWQGPAPRREYVDNLVHYNWHWRWHWGNGELGNNGVHALDLCRWGLQVDFPIAVTSSGGRYAFDDDQETPDTHTVTFEFADRKAISWQGLSCNSYDSAWVTFYGESGTLDLEADGSFTVLDGTGNKVHEHRDTDGGEQRHVANFIDAIRADDAGLLACDITTAHRSTLLCHLGNIAHRTADRLECDPANGHILNSSAARELWSRQYDPRWEPRL